MILCAGEALIDMIPTPTLSDREGFVPHTGGAVFNTAVALGRLGARSGLLCGISTDLFGQQLMTALVASHVDVTHVIRSDRPTTLAFVQLTDGHATYSFFDENSAGRMIGTDDIPPLSDDVTALYCGGISLACEPGAETYAHLVQTEGTDRAVMLDPNIRPGFIQDSARYRARLTRVLALSDIVKVSDEDLNWIFPGPEPLTAKIDMLRDAGPKIVIMTRGGAGVTAILPDGAEITVPAQRVEVVDTVGAGDTFNAGVLAHLSENGLLTRSTLRSLSADDLTAALRFGARVAAVTVSRAGANPPWREELSEQ
jgi:fructokinase